MRHWSYAAGEFNSEGEHSMKPPRIVVVSAMAIALFLFLAVSPAIAISTSQNGQNPWEAGSALWLSSPAEYASWFISSTEIDTGYTLLFLGFEPPGGNPAQPTVGLTLAYKMFYQQFFRI